MLNRRCMKPFALGMLPTTYDESMTFLEKLICMNKKINEIIEYLKDFSIEEIDNLINEKITNLKNYVDLQDQMVYNNSKNYTDEQLAIEVNLLKNLINEKVVFLLNYIDNSNNILKIELQQKINELKQEIDDIIINGINLYDPTTRANR